MNEKKIKVAMLGHKRIPSREGGVEIVVEELATRMVNKGHKVTCYNRKGHHVSGKEFSSDKGDCHKGIYLKNVWALDIKGLAAMTSSLTASISVIFRKDDIIHYHAEGPCAMMWIPKLFGKKCIATIHGLDWQREKWKNKFASKYIKFGEKIAVRYADEIIVLSRGVQKYFLDTYNRKTIFITNGITRPTLVQANEIKEKYGFLGQDYILFLGRLVPEKGLRYLIQAFRQLKTDKKLVIAGGTSDTDTFIEEIRELAKGDERIIFTGFVQGKMLEELYSNAYTYVLPSDLEGMPLSLLEAMSYGNCCLVSDIPECTEVVEDKAVVFRKSDIEDLRDKLQKLCDDADKVQKYKDEAADFICGKYNWDDVVEQTVALYKE